MIRVIIAEDHHMVRQSLRMLIDKIDDFEVIGDAEDGQQVMALAHKLRPDVVVMDVTMPNLNGIEATKRLSTMNISVVMLSVHDNIGLIKQALRSGAKGYVLKQAEAEELWMAIRAAAQGSIYLSPEITAPLLEPISNGDADIQDNPFLVLSSREREVFHRIVEGNTNQNIAEALDLSIKTIEKHRSSLMRKLNVHSLPELMKIALKYKFISYE